MLNPEILHDLITYSNTAITPGIERMTQILALLQNPQHLYKTIHITGTNGKGSTASFITTGLIHAGFKVGKFSSPHVHNINENITVNNHNISDTDLIEAYTTVKSIINQHQIVLSPFELLTTIMFYYFAKIGIDYLVLEVGLGGLNDATNVVNSTIVIITNIGLEHTQFLGNTLADIAYQKAGIIKPGSYVILGESQVELLNAARAKTTNYVNVMDKYTTDVVLDPINFKTNINISRNPSNVDDINSNNHSTKAHNYQLSLFGKFQAYNFLCAYEALATLNIAKTSIEYAASHTKLPYRLQLVSQNPKIIMDATHNPDGAKAMYQSLANMYKPGEVVIITSILKDKDIEAMLRYFNNIVDSIIFTSITNTDRALSANQLARIAQNTPKCRFSKVDAIDEPILALEYAKSLNKKLILITGSFYLLSNYDSYT